MRARLEAMVVAPTCNTGNCANNFLGSGSTTEASLKLQPAPNKNLTLKRKKVDYKTVNRVCVKRVQIYLLG